MMADAGDEQRKGEPGKKKGKPGKKARKAKASKRRTVSDSRRRANMIYAIAHPLRRCVLRQFNESEEPLSPVQVGRMLNLPTGLVAYHVTVLKRLGALEPVVEQQVRGAIEHFYDSTIEDDPPIETLLEETKDVDEEDLKEMEGK